MLHTIILLNHGYFRVVRALLLITAVRRFTKLNYDVKLKLGFKIACKRALRQILTLKSTSM